MIRRRAFVAGMAAIGVTSPARARTKMYRIGVVWVTTPAASAPLFEAFLPALDSLGYVPGRDVLVEQRWANGEINRIPELIQELIKLKVDLLVAPANRVVAEAKRVTADTPIVMIWAVNPIGSGFVSSMARPGTNVTGVTIDVAPEIVGKSLELLREVLPRFKRVAFLWNPTDPGFEVFQKAAEVSASRLNLVLRTTAIQSGADIDAAFSAISSDRTEAVLLLGGPIFVANRDRVLSAALERHVPVASPVSDWARWGAMIGYGVNYEEGARRAAVYVDRILKGANPAELPIEQPSKFELVINLKTAKALALTIPPSLLLRADQVIE